VLEAVKYQIQSEPLQISASDRVRELLVCDGKDTLYVGNYVERTLTIIKYEGQ
jgi:hypothetical protein